ncbi:MAG: sodium:solute symporter family protein [Lentisphaeria bacterium]|nr:sodium:solute symporter family protein [Lentisphaeria bacterium]
MQYDSIFGGHWTLPAGWLWGGILLYVLLMLLIGGYASRKVRSMTDFIVAGRRLTLFPAVGTLLATWFGAGTCIGISAAVYKGGIHSVIADPFAVTVCLLLAGFFLAGVLRRMNYMTVTDIIHDHYGRGAGIYASLWMIPAYIGLLSAQILGIGTVLHLFAGWDLICAQLVAALVILLYTAIGGMWAVTLTDQVQMVLILVGLFLILPGAVREAGGWQSIVSSLNGSDSILPTASERASFSGMINYGGNWMIMGLGCIVGQDLLQRSLACKDERTARNSTLITAALYFFIALIPLAIGLAARIILPKWGVTPEMMGNDLENQVMPRIAAGILTPVSPVLLILFLGALISAIMSTADSSLLAASSLLIRNVIQPLFPSVPDKSLLLYTRIATVLLIVLSTVLSMMAESVYALMISASASQLVIVLLPVFAAIYLPSASRSAVWTGMLAGTVSWLGYLLYKGCVLEGALFAFFRSDMFQYELTNGAVYGFFAALVGFFFVFCKQKLTSIKKWPLRRFVP